LNDRECAVYWRVLRTIPAGSDRLPLFQLFDADGTTSGMNSAQARWPECDSDQAIGRCRGGTDQDRQGAFGYLSGAVRNRESSGRYHKSARGLSIHDDGCIAGQRDLGRGSRAARCQADPRQRGFDERGVRTNRPLHTGPRRSAAPVWPRWGRPICGDRILNQVAASQISGLPGSTIGTPMRRSGKPLRSMGRTRRTKSLISGRSLLTWCPLAKAVRVSKPPPERSSRKILRLTANMVPILDVALASLPPKRRIYWKSSGGRTGRGRSRGAGRQSATLAMEFH